MRKQRRRIQAEPSGNNFLPSDSAFQFRVLSNALVARSTFLNTRGSHVCLKRRTFPRRSSRSARVTIVHKHGRRIGVPFMVCIRSSSLGSDLFRQNNLANPRQTDLQTRRQDKLSSDSIRLHDSIGVFAVWAAYPEWVPRPDSSCMSLTDILRH